MDTTGSIFSNELISQNIILKPVASTTNNRGSYISGTEFINDVASHIDSDIDLGFDIDLGLDPTSVRIDQAAGGFSTVVENSARHCYKVFNSKIRLPSWIPFDADIPRRIGLVSSIIDILGVKRFKPLSLKFEDNNQVRMSYELEIGYQLPNLRFPQGTLGYLSLEVLCPYSYETNMGNRSIDVYALMDQSTLVVKQLQNNPYLSKLLRLSPFGHDNVILKDIFTRKAKVHLIPTIAVAGWSTPTTLPTEFENFNAIAFHVTNPINTFQAMAVAINLRPGFKGLSEDVTHFIGKEDYGIITDEFRVEKLFRYKWRMGGFLRSYPLSQNIQVKRNSHVEEATLHGHLAINSLQIVSFEIHANTGADTIKISGSSSVHTQYLQLTDGTRIYENDAEHIDFGDPEVMPWIFESEIKVDGLLAFEPMLLRFQRAAYKDAYQYISRPFANNSGRLDLTYTRLQSVTKQIFVLGTYPVAFI